MTDRRYPWAPLAAAMGLSEASAARALGVTGSTEQEYRRRGVTDRVAERLAGLAGLHPSEVWPELIDDRLADLEADRRARYNAAQRKWRSKPGPREASRVRCRAYYAETAEYHRAYRRRRYAENAEAERAARRERYRRSVEAKAVAAA